MFVETQELPWPDDMVVSGVPIQLVPGDTGDLLGEKSQTLDNVVPSEYNPASYPQYDERTFEFRRMALGMGTKRQRDGFPRTVYYDLFVDGSIGGVFGLGPHFHSQNGVAGQEARDGVVGLDAGVEKEFGGFGRYAYKRNGDGATDWVLSKDFGVGRTVMQMARFKNRGGTVTDSVYVVLDNGALWQYDGATWTQAVLPAGFLPTAVEVVGDDMFLAGAGELRSVTADPLLAANYSGAVFVGEAGAAVTWMRALQGQLFVFKEDGVYAVSGLGGTLEVTDLAASFRNMRSVLNGRGARAWDNAIWFRWGDTLWKLTSEGGVASFETVGLSVLMENDSEVRGTPIGFTGHNNWFGYVVVVNGTDSYLCKWGTWLNPTEADPEKYRFAEVPHGALFKWTGKVASRIWTSAIRGASANQLLLVGFADGTVEYCLLPKGSPSPFSAGAGTEFTLTPGKRFVPEVDCDWPSENKSWRAVSAFAWTLDASNVMRHFYRTSSTAAWTEMTEQFTSHAQRVDFPSNFGSKSIQQYVQLETVSITSTPVVEGFGLHYSVVPEVILEYTGAADARLYRVRRDGSVDERAPDVIRQVVLGAVGTVGAVACRMPDRSQRELNFFRYTESLDKKWTRIGLEWVVPFKAIEFRTTTVYGTHRRMEAYTHAQLESFGSHRALETL